MPCDCVRGALREHFVNPSPPRQPLCHIVPSRLTAFPSTHPLPGPPILCCDSSSSGSTSSRVRGSTRLRWKPPSSGRECLWPPSFDVITMATTKLRWPTTRLGCPEMAHQLGFFSAPGARSAGAGGGGVLVVCARVGLWPGPSPTQQETGWTHSLEFLDNISGVLGGRGLRETGEGLTLVPHAEDTAGNRQGYSSYLL